MKLFGAADSLPQCQRDIEMLIPHKGRMCLLERVLACDENMIRCETLSHQAKDNPLRNAKGLPASTAVEYAAQAVAIQGALLSSVLPTDSVVRGGYLAALSGVTWQVDTLHDIGGALVIEVCREIQTSTGVSCSFTVSYIGKTLVEGSAMIAFMDMTI